MKVGDQVICVHPEVNARDGDIIRSITSVSQRDGRTYISASAGARCTTCGRSFGLPTQSIHESYFILVRSPE